MSLSDLIRETASISEAAPTLECFIEEPVSLDVFVRDKKFLGNPALSLEQYNAVRSIERVYYADLYPQMGEVMDPYWSEEVPLVNFVTLQWG